MARHGEADTARRDRGALGRMLETAGQRAHEGDAVAVVGRLARGRVAEREAARVAGQFVDQGADAGVRDTPPRRQRYRTPIEREEVGHGHDQQRQPGADAQAMAAQCLVEMAVKVQTQLHLTMRLDKALMELALAAAVVVLKALLRRFRTSSRLLKKRLPRSVAKRARVTQNQALKKAQVPKRVVLKSNSAY